MVKMPRVRPVPVLLLVGSMLLPLGPLGAAPTPRPSTFFGTVTVAGSPVAPGTPVSAWLGGKPFAETGTFEVDGQSVYRLDVPGDLLDTVAVEGGVEGQEVVFRIGNALTAETGIWSDGAVNRVDLRAEAGPDLAVTKDDGVTVARPGDLLTYTITVSNAGPGAATGIVVEDPIPLGTSFVSASDGGAAGAGVVTWPAFDLADGASTTRTLTVEVAGSFPAGTTEIVNTATALDDGSSGADPDLADNSATDADALEGGPDVVVTKTADAAQAVPGAELIYTVTLENRGFQPASDLVLTDTLPAEVTFLSASDDGRAVDGVVTWPAVELAVGDVLTRTVRVQVDSALSSELSELTNSAEAPASGDPEPANNTFAHTLPVARQTDLAVLSVDDSGAQTDPQTLAITGEVAVELTNLGTDGASGFDVAIFEDRDGDEAFSAATDNLLGTAPGASVAPGGTVSVPVPLSGTVLFRDNRLFAFADSGDVLDELDETNNIDHSARDCASVPPPEDFAPVVELSWPLEDTADSFSADSLSTPLVVQLTDDDGNGRLDERDVPDLVFVTYDLSFPLNPAPRLRAIRGDTGATIWDALPPISGLSQTFALTGAASGDLDLDGRPEIVVSTFDTRSPTGRPNRIAAYEHTGALKWVSPTYSTHPDGDSVTNRDNPAIADLDGDGRPEIIVGANVFDATGSLLWEGTGGQGYQSARNDDGFDSGAISIVADLDLDGSPEVVTGNTAYRADGTILWQIPRNDGYPAVANFDSDEFPEIVVVSRGVLRLHEHDGTVIWGPVELPGAGAEAGGAPTVANFDDDPAPEIGVAGSTQYTVFEADGTVKWQAPTQDGSSNMTGSTVFDLDGDGRFEVIYRDETALRIYRGEDGVVLYELPLSSITLNEQPVVADVDRDGNAEIVVTSDLADGVTVPERTRGLRILGDADDHWIAARPVWNQHAYHVTNVAADGYTIPSPEDPSWLAHNTYRANVAPPSGAFSSPDVTASRIEVDLSGYPTVRASARIGNGGTTFVPAGLPVAFYDGDPTAGGTLLGVATVDRDLDLGNFADVTLDLEASGFGEAEIFAAADDDGTGAGSQTECDEANNVHGIVYDTDVLGLLLDLDDGRDAVQPGETFTYTATISNGSLFARSGVALTHTLSSHVTVVSISDGGAEAGGVVSWPAFDLAGGATTTRSLTLRVDPAIPLSVTTLTQTASVTDDGSQGPDPTPSNNSDSDTDSVLTVSADAGGSYAGDEGRPVSFDGSASSDRDGTVVEYEWDFDRDGVIDATGVTASHAFDDDGVFTIELRVTDDSGEQDVDTAEVTVANLPPTVDAGSDQTLVEGDAAGLSSTVFTDPGAADTHTATIDWGDGTVTAGVLDQAAGTVAGGHDYPDDGIFPVEICVTDDDGGTGCDGFAVTVDNALPVVNEPGDVDLTTWRAEHWTHTGHPNTPDWVVASDGLSVVQTRNAPAAVFYGDFPAFGTRTQGRIRVETSRDDDFIGFALGYSPGDVSNPDADFLLLDWKQRDQGDAKAGLAVSRVTGLEPTLNTHEGETIEELARGIRFGDTGWQDRREYEFTIDFTPSRLRVFIDGVLEIDLVGTFSGGRLAFYNASQQRVRYSAFSVESLVADEGRPLGLSATFGDLGLLDTHTASVDWGDGAVEPAAVDQESGFGTVNAEHVYPDDAVPGIEVCVTDDDGGTGCGSFPAQVNNLSPVVEAGGDRLAYTTEGLEVVAPYSDGGLLDTHTATIDWGDGSVETVPAETTDGAGTITGSHAYADEGEYPVEVCVTDDDGGVGCDRFRVTWLVPVVDLAVNKRTDRVAVRPEEEIHYDLFVSNEGTREPENVVVTDQLPDELTFVAASSGGAYDPGAHTVTWELPVLHYQARTRLEVTARARSLLPFDVPAVNTVSIADDGRFGADEDPSDNSDTATVRLWDGATPIVDARPSVNLSRTANVFADASSEGGLSVSVSRVIDGRLNSSWFAECGDAANQGGAPFAEVVLPRDATVEELRVFGNRQSANGHDIFSGFFQLFDAEGTELFDSHELALPGPERDLDLEIPSTAGVRRIRFTSTDDESCNPGLAEIEVLGFYGDAQRDTITEGTTLDLDAAFFDNDPTEGHSATIDWGDGSIDAGILSQSGAAGTVDGQHLYPEDGEVAVRVCVTDDAGNTGCDAFALTVANVAPSVNQGDIDLRLWHPETYDHIDHPNEPNWVVADDGKSVIQTVNAPPSVFVGDFPAFGTRITGRIVVETTADDDYIGFVLGYEPGDHSNPDADYLLIDWKQRDQGTGRRGLAVSRVQGILSDSNDHTAENIEELARGINLGDVGWIDRHEYTFTFEFNQSRLRLFVDDVLELDIGGSFSNGRLAFFNSSQERVRYRAFEVESLVLDEGGTTELLASFNDPGVLDTHTATVDWRDGTPVEPAAIEFTGDTGFVTGTHRYLEDALYQARVCVTDDEQAVGCGDFDILVRNLPPIVEAGEDREGFVGVPFALAGSSFTDAGVLDTHTATIDWGDGSTTPGAVTEDAGAGTISASHVYGAAGTYTVEVCATDDEDGTGCDSLRVGVIERPPEVSIGDATVSEGNEGTTEIQFPLTLAFPAPAPLTVSYATADGTALGGEDFTAASGTVTIPTGAASGAVVVEVEGDVVDELDETFSVSLSAEPPIVVVDGEAVGTITDDDTAALSIDDVTIEEGDSDTVDALFTVRLATEADRDVGVSYATGEDPGADGAAEEDDFLATSGELTFAPGETAATVAVPVVGDLLLEPDEETFFVDLADPSAEREAPPIEDERGVGTILDDERCPGPNLLANPGAEARPVDGEIPGWSETEGTDWQWWRGAEPPPLEGAAAFLAGEPAETGLAELIQDVDLLAYAERIPAGSQRFAFEGFVRTGAETPPDVARIVVEYRDAGGLVLDAFDSGEIASPSEWQRVADERAAPPATASVRVRLLATRFTATEADAFFDALSFRSLRAPALAIDDVTVFEGDSGTTDAVFPVTLSCPYHREVTTAFATADGTAVETEDYLAASGTLVFPVGETTATVPVPVVGDRIDELHESFTVNLSAATPSDEAVLAVPEGLGTILNDDWCPRTRGFWKNHVEEWTVDFLVLGGVEYEVEGILDLLRSGGPDPSTRLASHLAATKLNLARGARDRETILPTVEEADAFLEVYPPGSRVKGAERKEANDIKDRLDRYNNADCNED